MTGPYRNIHAFSQIDEYMVGFLYLALFDSLIGLIDAYCSVLISVSTLQSTTFKVPQSITYETSDTQNLI